MKRLQVAIVDEELPFPANSGKRIRTLSLITRLARHHDISYFAHRNQDSSEVEPAKMHLRNLGITPVIVDRATPRKSGLVFWARLGENLFSDLPYSVATHTSRELRKTVQRELQAQTFDLWQCEWTPYAQLFRSTAGTRLLVMAHNVESLIWQRYFETESNRVKRWYIKKQWQKFERFERWAFTYAARMIAVSDEDAEIARCRFGASRTDVVENGVDTKYFENSGQTRHPHDLLFLGSLDWRPNLDGVAEFLKVVLPQVVNEIPDVRLLIVGRNPPDWLIKAARHHSNIELHSNVPDVRPFLEGAGVMIVPLRVGGGSRLKILEAAANELPVVSTLVGAEGLRLNPGEHYLAVDSISEMAKPIIHCVRNHSELRPMAASAKQIVCTDYDWDGLAEKLDRIWRECVVCA